MDKKKIIIFMTVLILGIVLGLLIFKIDSSNDYEVRYMVDGKVYATHENKLEEPEEPEKEGYEFIGWYYNDELFDFDKTIDGDITLEARFKKVEVPKEEEKNEIEEPTQEEPVSGVEVPEKENKEPAVDATTPTEETKPVEENKKPEETKPTEEIKKEDVYTYKISLIDNDKFTVNRLVEVYKNDEKIKAKAIYGNYNNKEQYKLGQYNETLKDIKIVSLEQFKKATNYVVELNDGTKVYVSEK